MDMDMEMLSTLLTPLSAVDTDPLGGKVCISPKVAPYGPIDNCSLVQVIVLHFDLKFTEDCSQVQIIQ